MAFDLTYTVTNGVLPITVELLESGKAPNVHIAYSQGTFTNVDDGTYTMQATDSVGCIKTEVVTYPPITTTTTTTTLFPLAVCLENNLIFDNTLPFTPSQNYWTADNQSMPAIVETSEYIFIGFNDSFENDAKHHQIYRYTKSNGAVATQRITTTNAFCCDIHKYPTMLITSNGTLLVAIEQLPGNSNHNGAIDIFRWTDLTDLTTYDVRTIGDNSTDRLAYPDMYEINGDVVIEARKYGGSFALGAPYRVNYKSTDDGNTFGTINIYIDYADPSYWIYKRILGNLPDNPLQTIIMIQVYYEPTTSYKYFTFLRTDFVNYYTLDGTNLGTTVNRAELEANLSYGITTENSDGYFPVGEKVVGNHIYTLVNTTVGGSTVYKITKTNINDGTTTVSADLTTITGSTQFFNICDDLYIVNGTADGTIRYWQVAQDLSSVSLMYTDDSKNYSVRVAIGRASEFLVTYAYDNSVQVYRMQDPDIVWDLTTTTSTSSTTTTITTLSTTTTTTTTSVTPTTTTTTTSASTLFTGLISVYEFDETSGTTAFDAHGSNDGAVVNATINQTGKIDKCYLVDSGNEWVNTNFNTELTTRTYSAWIRLNSYGGSGQGRIIDKRELGTDVSTFNVNSNGSLYYNHGFTTTSGSWKAVGVTLGTGIWRHVVVTYDSSSPSNTPTMYVNGSALSITVDATPSGVAKTNTDNYIIGNIGGLADRHFDGLIDQVAIWNRILTSEEITTLYNSGNGLAYINW